MDFSSLHATILQSIVHYWLKKRSKNRTANVGLKFIRVSAHFILDVLRMKQVKKFSASKFSWFEYVCWKRDWAYLHEFLFFFCLVLFVLFSLPDQPSKKLTRVKKRP